MPRTKLKARKEFYGTRLVFTCPSFPDASIWFTHSHVWTLGRMLEVARLARETFADMGAKDA